MMTDIEENQIVVPETLWDRFNRYTVTTNCMVEQGCCLLLMIGTFISIIAVAIVYSGRGDKTGATIALIMLGIVLFCSLFCAQTCFRRP